MTTFTVLNPICSTVTPVTDAATSVFEVLLNKITSMMPQTEHLKSVITSALNLSVPPHPVFFFATVDFSEAKLIYICAALGY